jgi:anthranilate synthase component II
MVCRQVGTPHGTDTMGSDRLPASHGKPASAPQGSGGGEAPRVVVVDHYDSYTWNLVHLVAEVTGEVPTVVEHDRVTLEDLAGFSHVVLSPGPGHPQVRADFSVGRQVLLAADRPVLGVCLGLQGLVTTYGGVVTRAVPAHGDIDRITHTGTGLFTGLPQGFAAVRYHSLAAVEVPPALEVTARSADGVVMGVAHRTLPLSGVQFHPESVLSTHGARIVANFLAA